MKRSAFYLLILLGVLCVFGCGKGGKKGKIAPESGRTPVEKTPIAKTAKKAPITKTADFALTDINGGPFRLSDYSGNVIILNFFATWCPPCREEMPAFNQISREYPNDVTVIAVNVGNEPLQSVSSFVSKYGLRFTVAMDDGSVGRLYGPIRAIPVTVVIGRDFNIARRIVGSRSKEAFVEIIKSLL